MLHVTFRAPRFLKWLLDFGKLWTPAPDRRYMYRYRRLRTADIEMGLLAIIRSVNLEGRYLLENVYVKERIKLK